MSVKSESIEVLLSIINKSKEEKSYNIVADLKILKNQFKTIRPREFKELIDALVNKYEFEEAALVHSALMKRCAAGDMAAIKMYHELQSSGIGSESEVRIIDDI